MNKLSLIAVAAVVATLSACASAPMMMMKVDNAALPEAVRVPAGQKMLMSATGVGDLTCWRVPSRGDGRQAAVSVPHERTAVFHG